MDNKINKRKLNFSIWIILYRDFVIDLNIKLTSSQK